MFAHVVALSSGFRSRMSSGFPMPRRFGWWLAAWLALVVTQSVLAVHTEIAAGHADDEQCELCAAAAAAGAAVPVSLPSPLLAVPAPGTPDMAPDGILLVRQHSPLQPRAPPAALS
jgi:hypothetical protein